jgi:hypothetical protein
MTLHPKTPMDLSLAPVAANIDHNLKRLRGKSPDEISLELLIEFDKPIDEQSRDARAAQVLRQALRDVDLHGWNAELTPDASAVQLSGGSVSLDVAVGAKVASYIQDRA